MVFRWFIGLCARCFSSVCACLERRKRLRGDTPTFFNGQLKGQDFSGQDHHGPLVFANANMETDFSSANLRGGVFLVPL